MNNNPLPDVAFGEVLTAYGMAVGGFPIADGKLHRHDMIDEAKGKKSGWYVLYGDGLPAGSYGDWRTGESINWCMKSENTLTPAEKAAFAERMAKARADREAEEQQRHSEAAKACNDIWARAKDATTVNAYCQRKGIKPYGCKVFGDKDTLIIPVYDGKALVNLQFIHPDGTKRFKTGGKKKGCYTKLGDGKSKTVVITTGFATGASIVEATGFYVVCALDDGNLSDVANIVKSQLPADWRMVIVGDNDAHKPVNGGLEYAQKAAESIGVHWVVPDFTTVQDSKIDNPTDFNDLHQLAGLEAVKAQIEAAFNTEPQAKPAQTETDQQVITRLSKLPMIEFMRVLRDEAANLGITASDLKKLVKEASQADDKPPLIEDIEPWDTPVNGADVLDEVFGALKKHVIADAETLHLATLWVSLTYLTDVATILPIALITAPEKNCGKSTLLVAMSKLAKNALVTSNMSSAVLFRLLDKHQPSLFIDEVDTWLRDNEELRGILNAGHTKDAAFVWRCEGDNFTPKQFSVWGAKALSGIGAHNISDTIQSRSIILNMRRKLSGETAANIRHTPKEHFHDIKRKLARWADDNCGDFAGRHPVMEGMNNRDQDNYEPLLAIAQLAGGDWVSRLGVACRKAAAQNEEPKSVGVEILERSREAFDRLKTDKIFTNELLEFLLSDDESIFATYNRGRPITTSQLSKGLRAFGIKSKSVRRGYETKKGFDTSQFFDAWKTYIDGQTDDQKANGNVTKSIFSSDGVDSSVTPSQLNKDGALRVTDSTFCDGTKNANVTRKPAPVLNCDGVTFGKGENGEKLKNDDDGISFETQNEDVVLSPDDLAGWLNQYEQAEKRAKGGGL